MAEPLILALIFTAGILVLVAEIFIPSHGILSLVGLALLATGVVRTFMEYGRGTGVVAVLACMIVVPAVAFVAIKYWHRTPIGKMISPPNPILTSADIGVPVEELERLVGQTGKALSALRPAGICDFNGKRVSCITEFGLIDAGVAVEAVRISGSNLAVVEKKA